MKTWFVTGVLLMVAGLLAVLRGQLDPLAAIARRESVTTTEAAEAIGRSLYWTTGGFSAFGFGLFLTIAAAFMYVLRRNADKNP